MFKDKWYIKLIIVLAVFEVVAITMQLLLSTNRSKILGIGLPGPMVQFTSTYHQFSIDYPKSWVAIDAHRQVSDGIIANITLPPKLPGLIISKKEFSNLDANNLLDWSKKNACAFYAGCIFKSSESYNSSFYEGILLHFERDNDLCLGWYILNENTGYSLKGCTPPKHWEEAEPVFMEMIDSFQLLDEQ